MLILWAAGNSWGQTRPADNYEGHGGHGVAMNTSQESGHHMIAGHLNYEALP